MKKQILDKKALDAIGKKLVSGDRLPIAEIERIIANPRLFAMVGKRIEADAASTAASVSVPFFRQKAPIFAGIAIFVVAAMAAVSLLRPDNQMSLAHDAQVSDVIPETARPVSPPKGKVIEPATGRAFKPDGEMQKANTHKAKPKSAKRKNPRSLAREPDGEFYALSFAGDPGETDGRIIRVDVPRTSLFALGVNIPLENGPEFIKADLLVGSDGVTRAIRVVK